MPAGGGAHEQAAALAAADGAYRQPLAVALGHKATFGRGCCGRAGVACVCRLLSNGSFGGGGG